MGGHSRATYRGGIAVDLGMFRLPPDIPRVEKTPMVDGERFIPSWVEIVQNYNLIQ